MAELTESRKKWREERKAVLNKVEQILEEISNSSGGRIQIELEIGCIPSISYAIDNLYVIPKGDSDD